MVEPQECNQTEYSSDGYETRCSTHAMLGTPPMRIAPVVGWMEAETPSVVAGLRIEALATGLEHPRSLYVLPNGDVLVVESRSPGTEPVKRPKEIIMHWVESFATGGGSGPTNRITLLRHGDGDGVPVRSVFLDHLNSPFGVALIGNDLYVANTDAIVHYIAGDIRITAAGTVLTPLPGGPINHHWTKSLVASSGWFAALCRSRLEQQHHGKRHFGRKGSRFHSRSRSSDRTISRVCERLAQPERLELGAADRRTLDGGERAG